MCVNAEGYLSDTQSYNEEAVYKSSKGDVSQVHFEDLIGKTKLAVKIGTKVKSVKCFEAGRAECEFEHAKATKEGKILFRKPYNEAFKYETHPIDTIDKKENEGFTVVFDCISIPRPTPHYLCSSGLQSSINNDERGC